MVKKKKEEQKEKPSQKKPVKKNKIEEVVEVEEFSIAELLEKNNIKPLDAVGFINYYGLSDDFRREFETNMIINKFSEGEFNDMYERYMKREI